MLHPEVIQAGTRTRPAAEGDSPHVPNVPCAPLSNPAPPVASLALAYRALTHELPAGAFSGRRGLPEATCHWTRLLPGPLPPAWAAGSGASTPLGRTCLPGPPEALPPPPADVRLHAPKGNHGMDADSDSVLGLQLELCILT